MYTSCMGTSLSLVAAAIVLLSAGCCCGCCMHRVCAACPHSQVKDATGCKICLTEPTHTNRCTSECLHDVRLNCSVAALCCLLAVVLLLQAQGLCNT
jgi:hypothetical protein